MQTLILPCYVDPDGSEECPMNTPSCFVFTSFSISSCLRPRRTRNSMRITSVLGILAFFLNSFWIREMDPGLSLPALKNALYRLRTCFWRLLCLIIVSHIDRPMFYEGKTDIDSLVKTEEHCNTNLYNQECSDQSKTKTCEIVP